MTPFDNPPEPLPRDHPAWHALWAHARTAAAQQPDSVRGDLLATFGDDVNEFQRAMSYGHVFVKPTMRSDGLYFEVSVTATDTGRLFPITRVHASRLPMSPEELAPEAWLANANALVKGAPDTPEGIEGA